MYEAFEYRDPTNMTMTLDPTLCSIGKEKALSLISQALVNIKTKIEEISEKEKKDRIAYDNSLNISAENAWSKKISEYVKEKNGVTGNFFKRNWRKLLIFLHISKSISNVIAEGKQGYDKASFIEDYIDDLESNSCRDHDSYIYYRNRPLYSYHQRLMELKDAVEKSDSIGLSISDMNMISKYGEIK